MLDSQGKNYGNIIPTFYSNYCLKTLCLEDFPLKILCILNTDSKTSLSWPLLWLGYRHEPYTVPTGCAHTVHAYYMNCKSLLWRRHCTEAIPVRVVAKIHSLQWCQRHPTPRAGHASDLGWSGHLLNHTGHIRFAKKFFFLLKIAETDSKHLDWYI